jgi:quercetin dioxygenase-like cupin family protein
MPPASREGRFMSANGELFHRANGAGRSYWGPGDLYTFLVTGEESNGAYFAMEAVVPPGGGPPLHTHASENETFYVLEGHCTFHLGEKVIVAGPGDFVNIPIGTRHFFHNDSAEPVRLILTFTPSGIEKFFEETLERALDTSQAPPDNIAEVSARYAEAAPRYGMEFFVDVPV